MEPRQAQSKAWTPYPPELIEQIKNVFTDRFKEQIADQTVIVEGWIYPTECLLRIGLLPQGRLRQENFELSAEYDAKKHNVKELIDELLDLQETLWETHLTEPPEFYSHTWQPLPNSPRPVFFKFTTVNSQLEHEADLLLGDKATGLYNENAFDDEPTVPHVHGPGCNHDHETH